MGQPRRRTCGARRIGGGESVKPTNYSERKVDVNGWQVHLTSYQLDGQYHCTADNVSPGANLARVKAPTKEEAEKKALDRATELLSRTRRRDV